MAIKRAIIGQIFLTGLHVFYLCSEMDRLGVMLWRPPRVGSVGEEMGEMVQIEKRDPVPVAFC